MSKLNHWVSRVLTTGLLACLALLLVGVALTIARPDIGAVHIASIGDMPGDVAAGRPPGFFTLGLFVLLVTPALRVVALLIGFAQRRMWLFALFAVIVLVVLALSAFLGLRA